MAIELPSSRSNFIPDVPTFKDPQVTEYLKRLINALREATSGEFDNADTIRKAFENALTTTFESSDGFSVTVTNGLITGKSLIT